MLVQNNFILLFLIIQPYYTFDEHFVWSNKRKWDVIELYASGQVYLLQVNFIQFLIHRT